METTKMIRDVNKKQAIKVLLNWGVKAGISPKIAIKFRVKGSALYLENTTPAQEFTLTRDGFPFLFIRKQQTKV